MWIVYFLTFIIWPFGSVLFSFKRYSALWTKNIIWAFVVYYGYTFVLSNDEMDANRIKSKFEFVVYNDFDFISIIKYFFIEDPSGIDVIQPLIFYVTSLFTDSFQVLMGVLALIFGYFYSRNITFLLDHTEGKLKLYSYGVIWLFLFLIGFWEINAFRFWTSAHMFFYAVIPYIYNGKYNRFWLLPFIALLHFSFVLPIVILFVFILVKNKPKIFFYMFLASFLISSINTEAIGEILMRLLPSSYEYKVKAYTSAEYAAEVFSSKTSISGYLRKIMYVLLNIGIVIVYFYRKVEVRSYNNLYRLFTFVLLFATVSNFATLIPSGGRFLNLSGLFTLSFLFICVQKFQLKGIFKAYIQISVPLFILASFGFIRLGMNTINVMALLGNPFILFFSNYQRAFIELF